MAENGNAMPGPDFQRYASEALEFVVPKGEEDSEWRRVHDWYLSGGRDLFLKALRLETALKANPATDARTRFGAALPRNLYEDERKIRERSFYKAHAEWFLQEMDHIVSCVPRECAGKDATFAYANVLRFVRNVLHDSVHLFSNWGLRCAEPPRSYGMDNNEVIHLVQLFHGARQAIYGHGSFRLTFMDNHADVAIAFIRQAVEIRLRRAFGLIGQEVDGVFQPVHLGALFKTVEGVREGIRTAVPLPDLERAIGWANMFLHSGLKAYAWAPPRVLEHLRPFLLFPSGVTCSQAAFDAVRSTLETKVKEARGGKPGRAKLRLLPAELCDVRLTETSTAPVGPER